MSLGETEVHDVWSDEVADTFRIFVGHCGEQPRAAIFVTDANGLFGLTVDTVRLMQIPALLPPLLVVGIGYPWAGSIVDTIAVRERDLTPTASVLFEGSGGGDAFLRFVRGELVPWVEERFPSSGQTGIYFGHSLGGLFGVHALLDESPAFDLFVISSPSLWWDRYVMFERERRWAATHHDLARRVYVGIGGHETDDGRRAEAANLPAGHRSKPPATHLDMVDDLARFVEVLRGRMYPSLDVTLAVHPDEFHATVPAVVLTRGLRHFFSNA
jgi:ferri-bacillibactin esterase